MAQALPFVGAAVGGVIGAFTGQYWLVSAGWMIGSWAMNSLNSEETKVLDPGAEEMPRFNQALRGATMTVLFGTNRVAPHIVWQNNFTTIRHENSGSGGGGKFGGSGMGSKGGGGDTGEAEYEYKWDLMYHLGMSHEPINMYGGWLGPERLNSETLLSIINNSSSGFGQLFLSDVDRPQNADLAFDEAYWHGAWETGNASIENWSHFETQEGGPYRWPYTAYVGFKQMNLGSHARVPQLTFEVGPGDLVFSFDSLYKLFRNSRNQNNTGGNGGPSGGVLKGDDGILYQIDDGASGTRRVNVDDGSFVEDFGSSELDADATAIGLDPGGSYAFTSGFFCGRVAGTQYYLAHGYDIGFASRKNHAFVLYEVDENGDRNAVGGYQGQSNTLEVPSAGGSGYYLLGEGTDDSPIIFVGQSIVGADSEAFIIRLPSINQMKSIFIEDSASNNYESRQLSLRNEVAEIQDNFPARGSYRTIYSPAYFLVPIVDLTPAPSWSSNCMFYIGRSDIEWARDNPGNNGTMDDLVSAGSEGGIFGFNVAPTGTHGLILDPTWTDYSGDFRNRYNDGDSLIPFPDSGYELDETTVRDADDYDPNPQVQLISDGVAAGATAIVFWKHISAASADRAGAANTDCNTKARLFLWNPLEQKAVQYVEKYGSFADRANDWSYSSNYEFETLSGYYDEDRNKLYVAGSVDNASISNQKLFVSEFGTLDIGGGTDVVPPYIIRTILTDPVLGVGIPDNYIDDSTYNLAVQYCLSEDIKVSVQYTREENLLQVLEQLLSLYGGFLIDSGGKIRFGLQEFSATTVRTIDNDHLLVDGEEAPVQVIKGARQDVYNKVKVNYFDRNLEYRQNFVEVADEVDIDINGLRATEFAAKFVMNEKLANKIAIRTLWSNLYGRDQYSFKLGPKDSDLEPGDVITLVDSFEPSLNSGKQVRIVMWEEREPMKFNVRGVEEIEYINGSSLQVDSATEVSSKTSIFGPAAPAADFIMYELPKEFQGADAQVYVGWRQQQNAMGAHLFTSADGESFALTSTVKPYIISGILSGPLSSREPGYVEENVEVYLMPDTRTVAFNPDTPTYCQTHQLDDVGANGRALGAGAIWINSEMLAYEGVNLLGQNHYRFDKVYRGWGGTHIQGHSSGDTWHKHGGGVFAANINQDKVGSIIHYKVAPFNFAGVYYDIASVDARTYQIQGTYWKPQNQGPLHTYVQSPGSYLTVQSEDLGYIRKKNVISGGSPVQLEWPDVSRDAGYGAQGYGTGGYGRFTTDTTSHSFRVEVLSSDLSTVVRCTTVSTTAFLYSIDANSEDFNGWAGSFAVKVTPFNDIGDALRSRTKILELFE